MTVIVETRYGGVYEGGPWAAFGVSDPGLVPGEAFSGDPFVFDWWDCPTVPVGVGESPTASADRLRALVERDRSMTEIGIFAVGQPVLIARCAPDDWRGSGVATVESLEYRPSRPYVGGLRGQCVYTLSFSNASTALVPERYLRHPGADD